MANGFGANIQGLLESPTFNLGAGLLAASGPSLQPVGFGQALAGGLDFAGQRQQQINQNAMQRQALQQRKRRQEAIGELQGLLSPGQAVGNMPAPGPRIQTPEGRQQAMGLLGEVAPEQFAQGLLGQMFAQPEQPRVSTDFNTFAALNPGLSPGSPEFREGFMDFVREQGAGDDMLRNIQTQLAAMELGQRVQEQQREDQTREQERRRDTAGTSRSIRTVGNMLDNMQTLDDTFLQMGAPLPDLRRTTMSGLNAALSSFGVDRSEQENVVSAFDEIRKDFNNMIIDTAAQMGGRMTDQQQRLISDAMASPEISPTAAASILANVLEMRLTDAEIKDLDVPNLEQGRELIERLRNFGSPGSQQPSPSLGGNVIDFSDLPE